MDEGSGDEALAPYNGLEKKKKKKKKEKKKTVDEGSGDGALAPTVKTETR